MELVAQLCSNKTSECNQNVETKCFVKLAKTISEMFRSWCCGCCFTLSRFSLPFQTHYNNRFAQFICHLMQCKQIGWIVGFHMFFKFDAAKQKKRKGTKVHRLSLIFLMFAKSGYFFWLTVSNIDSNVNKRRKFSIYFDIILSFYLSLNNFHTNRMNSGIVQCHRFVCVCLRYLVECDRNLLGSTYQTVCRIYTIVCSVVKRYTAPRLQPIWIKYSFCLHTNRNTQLLPNIQTHILLFVNKFHRWLFSLTFTQSLSLSLSGSCLWIECWWRLILRNYGNICVKYPSKLNFANILLVFWPDVCASCAGVNQSVTFIENYMLTSISILMVLTKIIVNWKTLLCFSVHAFCISYAYKIDQQCCTKCIIFCC